MPEPIVSCLWKDLEAVNEPGASIEPWPNNVERRVWVSRSEHAAGDRIRCQVRELVADQVEPLRDELDEGRSDDLREELAAVERAEARLADGTYGLSVESGEPIPDERLEAMPWAGRTVEEQARYDRSG